jgi:hypothetical protein
MRQLFVAIGLVFSVFPALSQSMEELKRQELRQFEKFRGYIVKKDYNCPQVYAMKNYPPDAFGEVFQIFCGPKGAKPSGENLWVFRFTVTPKARYLVTPWVF